MAKYMFGRVLLFAVLAGCSAPSAAQTWNVGDLQGSWSLILKTDPSRGARIRLTPDEGGVGARTVTSQTFALDVSVRDGQIAGCRLNPGAGDDRCTIRDGVFYVETADPSRPAIVFALERRTATRFEGGAALNLPFFGRQTVGSAVMVRVR